MLQTFRRNVSDHFLEHCMKPKSFNPKASVNKTLQDNDDEWVQLNEKYTNIYKLTPYLLKWEAPNVPPLETLDELCDHFYDEHADESDEEWVSKNCPDKNKQCAQPLCCAGCFITIAYQSQLVLRHKKSIYFTTHDIVNCHVKVKDLLPLCNDSKRIKCWSEKMETSCYTENLNKQCTQIQPIVLCNNCDCILGFYDTAKKCYILHQAILSPE